MTQVGKALILFGIAIVIFGVVIWGLSSFTTLGRLPGDIYVRRGNFTFYFPVVTCILISVIASILWSLLMRR